MRGLVLGLATLGATLLAGCEKHDLDKRMGELCRKNGGVTVYETVRLPESEFSKDGVPLAPTLIGRKRQPGLSACATNTRIESKEIQ